MQGIMTKTRAFMTKTKPVGARIVFLIQKYAI
jgi:hypothetical protein